MSLRRELRLQRGLRLDFAEKNMSEEEVAVRGIGMILQVLADNAVGFSELRLLEERLRVHEKVFCLSR